MRTRSWLLGGLTALILTAGITCGSVAHAQDPTPPARRPLDVFRDARDFIRVGNLDLASQTLRDFLALKPTEQDFLDVESKFGVGAFQSLIQIPRWNADPKLDAEFKKTVIGAIIDSSIAANKKFLQDPARILKFVRNLGESQEEVRFAISELNRSGDAILPIFVQELQLNPNIDFQSGAMQAVTKLDSPIIPGLLIACEHFKAELTANILASIARRPDILNLVSKSDTDPTPLLWYWSTAPATQSQATKATATTILRALSGDRSDRQKVDGELIRMASQLHDRKGRFANYDTVNKRVKVWEWDSVSKTIKSTQLTTSQTEERYGLKFLQWALDRVPSSQDARELFLALATERGVERAKFNELSKREPALAQLLAATPSATLINALDTALTENRTALAYGIVSTLGERAERAAALPPTTGQPNERPKPGPLVRALSYPDPRVQLAAALALLNLPNVNHGANGRIVEVLSRAAGSETSASPMSKGKAIIADPTSARGDQLAKLLRQIGYDTEMIGTGRELLRRMKMDASIDLILLDRHVVEPTLPDLLVYLTNDSNAGRRPVMVVASSDQVQPLGLEQLLARLAVLVATTETNEYTIPPSYTIDRRKTKDENDELRKAVVSDRDKVFKQIVDARTARMARIVAAAKLPTTPEITTRVQLRITQLTIATLISEYEPTPDTAPNLFRDLAAVTSLIVRQKQNDPFIESAPTEELGRLILQLESAVTPDMMANFQRLRNATDYAALGLSSRGAADASVVENVKRQVRPFKGVSVIAEPYATSGLADDIAATLQDPAQMPRDPAEKKASMLAALDALRKLSTNQSSGYDLQPAIPALRTALGNDDSADAAIAALGNVNSAQGQQDLIRLATAGPRSAALRAKAIDAAVRNVQSFGRMTNPELTQALSVAVNAEANLELKPKLAQLKSVLMLETTDWMRQMMSYKVPTTVPTPMPPMPIDAKSGDEKKEEKKEN